MIFVTKHHLSRDEATCIKDGLNWILGAEFVLDRFHLSKYVKKATATQSGPGMEMRNYINNNTKKEARDLFAKLIKGTEKETKKNAIKDTKQYILGNWETMQRQKEPKYVGCSAECHVSHILSSRLGSRPLGWSSIGADQMVRIRVFNANGGKVYDYLKEKEKKKLLPTINIGKRTELTKFLRSVSEY